MDTGNKLKQAVITAFLRNALPSQSDPLLATRHFCKTGKKAGYEPPAERSRLSDHLVSSAFPEPSQLDSTCPISRFAIEEACPQHEESFAINRNESLLPEGFSDSDCLMGNRYHVRNCSQLGRVCQSEAKAGIRTYQRRISNNGKKRKKLEDATVQSMASEEACLKKTHNDSEVLSSSLDMGTHIKSWNSLIHLKRTKCPKRVIGQYFLDLGQSDFSYTTCRICGLLYVRGHEDDEKIHCTFHKNYLIGIKFKGWKNERVADKLHSEDHRIIIALPCDPPQHQNKVREVATLMENEMGLPSGWLLHGQWKVYLFISSKKVVGCLVAESIKEAYRVFPTRQKIAASECFSENEAMLVGPSRKCFSDHLGLCGLPVVPENDIPDLGGRDIANHKGHTTSQDSKLLEDVWKQTELESAFDAGKSKQTNFQGETHGTGIAKVNKPGSRILFFGNVRFEREINKKKLNQETEMDFQDLGGPVMCTNVPVPAICGVRGMWVSHVERRKGIASKLLDTMRATFCFGFVVHPSQCAFSQPTPDGKAFAIKYCQTQEFLVYH